MNCIGFVRVFIQVWILNLANGWFFSESHKCFHNPNIGCFPLTGHFTNSMGFSPKSPSEINVGFIHKTSDADNDNGNNRFSLRQTERKLHTTFNPSLNTILILHGYVETPAKPWITDMVNALRRQGPKNIFVVDWSSGAQHFNYFQCVANARVAGAIVALFLQKLVVMGASPSNFHIIGFSLGAHVAGYAGARLPGIGRITGLDPAGPGFVGYHTDVRLDPTDADIVDVVHTDKELGTMLPMGTIDFYPNGGDNQPSCERSTFRRISSFLSQFDFSRRSWTRTFGCSHIRATQLFTTSINGDCTFSMKRSHDVSGIRKDEGEFCGLDDDACPKFGYQLGQFQPPSSALYRFNTTGIHPYC